MQDDVFFGNVIELFQSYKETACEIEGEDIARSLQGKPTYDQLVAREADFLDM